MIPETPPVDPNKIDKKVYVIITLSVMLATVMQALDTTIANVALPYMQGSLAGTQDQMAWVLTSYIVASAIAIPLTGWMSTRIGRKQLFLFSIAGFVLTSILCGMAESLADMVVFRFLQGIAGAALVPLSQSILFSINTKENYGKAMALWGVGVTMGPILGPVLGGWLTQNYNWRWVFYINVPIGILAFLGLWWFLTESEKKKYVFDFFGFVTLAFAIGAFQVMLDRGQFKDWFSATEIIVEAVIAGVAFYLFMIHSLTAKVPFFNAGLFKDKNFLISTMLIFVLGIPLFATLALMPPMMQEQLNYPVLTIGVLMAPRGIGTLLGMMLVGRLVGRVDSRWLITIGLLIVAFSLHQMSHYSLLIDASAIIWPGVLQGFGIGLCYIALSTVAFTNLSPSLRDEGTAFFNLMRNLGSSIGISMVEAFLVRNTQIAHSTLVSHIIPYNAAANIAYSANGVDMSSSHGVAAVNAMITNQSMMIGYIDDFYLIMVITLVSLPLVLFLRKVTLTEKSITTGIE